MRGARDARRDGHLYLADCLARRAVGFARRRLTPNTNPLFIAAPLRQGNWLAAARDALDEVTSCDVTQFEAVDLAEAFLKVDTLLFRSAAERIPPPVEPSPKSLEQLEGILIGLDASRASGLCLSLAQAAEVSTIDWDLTASGHNGAQHMAGDAPMEVKLPGSLGAQPFRRELVNRSGSASPCVVTEDQMIIYFDIDSGTIEDFSAAWIIEAAGETLSRGALVVEGDADSGGAAWRNLELSIERALTVATLLAESASERDFHVMALGAHCPQIYMGPNS